jgi:hypothetical protein
MVGFSLVMTRVCATHVNPREEHDVEDDNGCYGSCCSTKVLTLEKDMENRANALHGFGALLFWDVWLGQDHEVLVFLIIHGDLGAYDDARVEDLGFEDSNPRMDI